MTIVFAILFVLVLGLAIFLLIKNKRLEDDMLRSQKRSASVRD